MTTITRRRRRRTPEPVTHLSLAAWPPAAQARLLHAVTHCDADAVRGTGTGVCDAPLDARGACPRADRHL
jgi:hypothetical protein